MSINFENELHLIFATSHYIISGVTNFILFLKTKFKFKLELLSLVVFVITSLPWLGLDIRFFIRF